MDLLLKMCSPPLAIALATLVSGHTSIAQNESEAQPSRFSPSKSRHWAFEPITNPTIPSVHNTSWPRSSIDHFILAQLEDKDLKPAPVAAKRILIRRATFDLTGLPPTPAEVEAFLADTAPDAFARVVDRLLSSPRYGERWARHWLDLARYADSNGMDENLAYASAFRYRDYVVAAFNQDKPYDQFIREQLAGDLLPPVAPDADPSEHLIATGFLSIGPKMLAEDDPMKMEMDIIDEQVDTIGRTFMGLTLGCARCHDHKFDPLPTADYYALAGIFKSTQTMIHDNVSRWVDRQLPMPAELEAAVQKYDAAVAKLKETIRVAKDAEAKSGKSAAVAARRSSARRWRRVCWPTKH